MPTESTKTSTHNPQVHNFQNTSFPDQYVLVFSSACVRKKLIGSLSFQTVANMVDGSFIQYEALKIVFKHYKEHLFEEFTVGGYLWGYEEKTLAAINNLTQKYLGKKIFSSDKFGLFYGVCVCTKVSYDYFRSMSRKENRGPLGLKRQHTSMGRAPPTFQTNQINLLNLTPQLGQTLVGSML